MIAAHIPMALETLRRISARHRVTDERMLDCLAPPVFREFEGLPPWPANDNEREAA